MTEYEPELQDGWCRTTALRYVVRRINTDWQLFPFPPVLQQQWVDNAGNVEWRDVPTVSE